MKNNKILLISPSGNLYGSEQVLVDYLKSSELCVDVCVPENSLLFNKIKSLNLKHNIISFNITRVWFLYIKASLWLLFDIYKCIYINEAGHLNYIIFLSYLFPNKKFFIHVRILEDTDSNRWKFKPLKNIKILTISKFIKTHLNEQSILLYDPYFFKTQKPTTNSYLAPPLKIGIIGRVTKTKGIDKLLLILEQIKKENKTDLYQFCLFGDISKNIEECSLIKNIMIYENVTSYGFEKNTEKLYAMIDCVLHLNQFEPLGRIFLEAINFKKPFIGFNNAGIKEIGILVNYREQLIPVENKQYVEKIISHLDDLRCNYEHYIQLIDSTLEKAKKQFNVDNYVLTINNLLLSD